MQKITIEYKNSENDEPKTREISYMQFLDKDGRQMIAYDRDRSRGKSTSRRKEFDIANIVSAKDSKTGKWINPSNLIKLIENPFFRGLDIEGKHYGLDDLCKTFRYGKPEEIQLIMNNIHNMDNSSLFHLSMELRKKRIKPFADEMDNIRIARDTGLEAVIDSSMADFQPPKKKRNPVVSEFIEAVDVNKTFSIEYQDASGNVTKRDISHIIFEGKDGLVIHAHCHLRGENKTFRADRILYICDKDTGEVINPYDLINLLETVSNLD